MLADQMAKLEQQNKVYDCKAGPVFAIKASSNSQGIKISEGGGFHLPTNALTNPAPDCPPGDKGKKKMYAEDELDPTGKNKDSGVDNSRAAPKAQDIGSAGICVDPLSPRSMRMDPTIKVESSLSGQTGIGNTSKDDSDAVALFSNAKPELAHISLPSSGVLGSEAVAYLQDSLLNMIDPPLALLKACDQFFSNIRLDHAKTECKQSHLPGCSHLLIFTLFKLKLNSFSHIIIHVCNFFM